MPRRNWSFIIPVATVTGYAAFHLWGALLAPAVAVAGFAWRDRRARRAAARDERRIAEFVESARKGLEEPPLAAPASAPEAPAPAAMRIPLTRAQVAARAIALASRANDVALAVALLREFTALRETFQLDAITLNRLGPALLEQGAYAEAAWVLHAASLAAGDPPAAGRRLAEVAGKAAAAGSGEIALQLYLELLERYPDAGLANFARARIEELRTPAPAAD